MESVDLAWDIEMYLANNGFDHAGTKRVVPKLQRLGVEKGRDLGKLTAEEVRSSGLDVKDQEKLLRLVARVRHVQDDEESFRAGQAERVRGEKGPDGRIRDNYNNALH